VIDGATAAQFHYVFMDRLAAMPGVESVGVVETLPLDEGAATARVATLRTDANGEIEPLIRVTFTGGDYFQTMGSPSGHGRSGSGWRSARRRPQCGA
jgi:hypothetical protein